MITHIKTIHEEQDTNGNRTFGVLLNYSSEVEHENWKESFIYMFRETEEGGRYIFFNTMFDMWSYILYSENKMKIAYMDEVDFDELYDAPFIDGTFNEQLSWV
jgi:hypothetical protein